MAGLFVLNWTPVLLLTLLAVVFGQSALAVGSSLGSISSPFKVALATAMAGLINTAARQAL